MTEALPSAWPPGPVLVSRLLVPRPRREVVPRGRLLERLSEGARGPLTLVHGPAGSGKTFLVAAWVAAGRAPGPVAWVTLDEDLDAPGPFWAHVLAALTGSGLPLGDDLGQPARADEIDRAFLARVAAALSESGTPVVLVLDEYDRLGSRAIDEGLDVVLRQAAPALHLVLISRRSTGLRLSRRRAAGEVTEVGPADLAFSTEETARLMALHGVSPPAEAVARLTARTEGWATALRLSALALAHGASPQDVERQLAGEHGDVADFLLSEVMDAEPPETQDLLLRTCLLERVDGPLADTLTGRDDGHRILHGLSTAGTFVRAIPGEPGWFRFHELFATALQGRLRHAQPELVPELRRRASQWLADHGHLVDAVAQAVAADAWDLATGHLVDHLAVAHLMVGLEARRLATLLAGLPETATSAEADLVRAALAMSSFDRTGCIRALDRAEAGSRAVTGPREPALRLGISTVRVIVSRLSGDLRTAAAAGPVALAAMEEVPAQRLHEHPELRALVLSSLGTLQLWGGAEEAADATLREGLAAAVGPFTEDARSNCLGQLAVLHYLRGELRQARGRALEALQLVDRAGLSSTTRVPVGHLAAALVALEWDDQPAARSHVTQAARSAAARADPSLGVLVALVRARAELARGAGGPALRHLAAVAEQSAQLSPASFVVPLLVLEEAAGLTAVGQPDRAVAVLEGLADGPPARRVALATALLAGGSPDQALRALGDSAQLAGLPAPLGARAHLVAARAHDASGRPDLARQALGRALWVARTEGVKRPFVESRAWVRRALSGSPELAERHAWLGAALTALPEPAAVEAAPFLVVEPLTDRELEVLRTVGQPMSSREAAEVLHLSVNTVKTHLRSIYRKLAAPTRNAAVRRARSLGIL